MATVSGLGPLLGALLLLLALGLQVNATVTTSDNEETPLLAFSWSNCGSAQSPLLIKSVTVGPDPVRIPGNATIGFEFLATKNYSSPLPFSIRIQKKVAFLWIDIPCDDGVGSCDYPDFCQKWPLPSPCPEEYKKAGVPCQCPIGAGHYILPPAPILPIGGGTPLPKWLENGSYKLKAWVNDPSGAQQFCLLLNLSLKAS